MSVRVTHRSIQESTLAHLQGNLSAISKLQEQVSSGKRINRPSDDPSGTSTSLQLRQQLRLNDQYSRNASDGTAWLDTTDTALQTTSSQLQVAQARVLQALNYGTASDGTRTALATEIDGIAQTVLSMANTTYGGRNVFAGTSGATAAVVVTPGAGGAAPTYSFAPTGAGSVVRQVDTSSAVPVDTDGRAVFGEDGGGQTSLFSLLSKISTEIKTPTDADGTALRALKTQLDDRLGKVGEALSSVGARQNRIEQAQAAAAQDKVTLTAQLSETEDADLPSTIVNLQLQSTAYQAALSASSKVLQTSLMDFLR